MTIDELKKRTKPYYIPSELRIADNTDGDKILYRMPETGEIVDATTKGAKLYRRFWAMLSTETVDRKKTIVTRNASVAAFLVWMDANGGNIRYMHEMDPVGRIFEGDYEIRTEGVYAGISIPLDEEEVLKKVDNGLIRFVSQGFDIDWSAENPVEWIDNDIMQFNRIVIVEVSIGDFGATKGTEIKEERLTQPESLLDKINKIYSVVKRLATRTDTGATPKPDTSPMEDDDMTPEQHKAMMDSIETRLTAIGDTIAGALKPLTTRVEGQEQPPEKPESTTGQEKLLERLEAIETRLSDLGTSISTDTTVPSGSITYDDLLKQTEAMEAECKRLSEQGATDDQKLSFIKNSHSCGRLSLKALRSE